MQTMLIKIKQKIHRKLFINTNAGYENSIFVAGSGRSGTTWISNIINYNNQYRFIFEPFHPLQTKILPRKSARPYLRPQDHNESYLKIIRAILSGQIRDNWTDKFNTKFLCDKRLIKEIRANLLLKWIQTNFCHLPLILTLRHPCAIAVSQIRLQHWAWNTDPTQFLTQDKLMADHLESFRTEIEKAKTKFEQHIFLWCIENYIPLNQFSPKEIHLAFYENFCETPQTELDRLFTFLGTTYSNRIWRTMRRPSPVSHKDSSILSGYSLIDNWRNWVTPQQLDRAIEILNLFGLDTIYGYNSMPNVDNAYKQLQNNEA